MSTSEVHRDSAPTVFVSVWTGRCFLPHILKFPEGKQVFSINYIVCTNNLGMTHHSYQEMMETLPNPSSQRPTRLILQIGLSKDESRRLAGLLSANLLITRAKYKDNGE